MSSMALVSIKVDIPLPEEVRSLALQTKLKRIDFLGSLTLVLTVGFLLLGLSLRSMEDLPWSHPFIWGLLSASIVWGFMFFIVETKVAVSPVMPIRLMKQRTPLAIALANLFASITSFSMVYNVPLVRSLHTVAPNSTYVPTVFLCRTVELIHRCWTPFSTTLSMVIRYSQERGTYAHPIIGFYFLWGFDRWMVWYPTALMGPHSTFSFTGSCAELVNCIP